MRLYRSLASFDAATRRYGRVVTVGAFDGLHLGHREIMRQTLATAAELGHRAMVISFEPMPAEFFAPDDPPARLTCFRERVEELRRLEVAEFFCPPFSSIRRLDAESFASDLLARALDVRHIVVGHDFRYGENRAGSLEDLRRAGARLGFGVTTVEPVYYEGTRISSTEIRQALMAGDLGRARAMLGRHYSMSGRVVHGRGLGKALGFPTANVNLKRRLAPVDGIFAVRVAGLGARTVDGVASVGSRPTIGGGKTLLEVYLFDFDTEIYGEYIRVDFVARLREERRFPDLPSMQAQMHVDVREARAALSG